MSANFAKRKKEAAIALDSLYRGTKLGKVEDYRYGKINLIENGTGVPSAKFLAKNKSEIQHAIMAMDAEDANFNTTSSGVPSLFTTVWTNDIVYQVTQAFAYKQICSDYQQGDFATTAMSFPTMAHSGEVSDYDDLDIGGQVGANANWEPRDVKKKQYMVYYGDLEVANMSAGKIDLVAEKREAGAITLAQTGNTIFFYGIDGLRIYGLLNDPNLNAVIPMPVGASDSSLWSTKTYDEIVKDIIVLWNGIVASAANQVNIGEKDQAMVLCTTPEDQSYLLQPNTYGQNAFEYIKKTFPGLRLVSAPQYLVGDGSDGNKVQLILEKIGSQKVLQNAFSYQLMAHRLVTATSSYHQKFSAGFAGALIKLPMGIATGSGI